MHSKKQLAQLIASIEKFGFTNPIVIDDQDNILAGHGRVLAAIKLGLSLVPCRIVFGLTDVEKRALIIADNRLPLNATWDETVLAAELRVIQGDLSFPVEVLGFDPVEIDGYLNAQIPADKGGDPEDDNLPEVGEFEVTVTGDRWVCGDHRIVCGDSRDAQTYSALLGDEKAEMVFSDPPYNVRIDGHVSGLGRQKHREFAMAAGEMSRAEFTAFLDRVFGLAAEFSTNGSVHYQCIDWRHLGEMTTAGNAQYDALLNVAVWDKGVGAMGSLYRSRHELVFVFKHGTAPHLNNVALGKHGRNRSNVWTYRGLAGGGADRAEKLKMHPTVKPTEMVADAMRDVSRRGGIVLDPFGGSGTTMIAAEKTRRRARLIEIDPLYVDVSVRRWQEIAKDDAIHAETGKTFNEHEAEAKAKTLKARDAS